MLNLGNFHNFPFIRVAKKFPSSMHILCENENVCIKEEEYEGESNALLLPEREIVISEKLPDGRMYVKSFTVHSNDGTPFVGMAWLDNISELVELTLHDINLMCGNYDNEKFSPSNRNSYDHIVEEGFSNRNIKMMIRLATEGPESVRLNSSVLSLRESTTDEPLDNTSVSESCTSASGTYSSFCFAIGLLAYWSRNGQEVDCPLAKLIGKFVDLGLFSLIPLFNTNRIEETRPILIECHERYSENKVIKQLLVGMLFKDDGELTSNEEILTNSEINILLRIMDEEWFKSELLNAEAAS